MKRTVYKAFGLTIASDLELPELPRLYKEVGLTDVIVVKANLIEKWSELAEPGRYFVIKDRFIMFQVPHVATYLIRNGDEIFVSPINNADESLVRLYLLGSCMGAILLQRRILPLHGSVVAINGKAYAIVGDSGAGKSTIASAFMQCGYKLLSDDVIPVTLTDEGVPIVSASYPQQKLWKESLHELGMYSDRYKAIIDRKDKFFVPIKDQFSLESIPLGGIFELVKTNEVNVTITPINNLERLHTLYKHTYRNFFIKHLGIMDWHFNIITKIVSVVDIYRLERPIDRFTAHELVDVLLSKYHKKEWVK